MKYILTLIYSLLALFNTSNTSHATPTTPPQSAVVSAHPLATKAGQEILEQGGNAFDAAVAMSAALAVVEPFGSGLGGGGFWLIFDAKSQQYIMVDARETAPEAAYKTMYLDDTGMPVAKASTEGPLAAGIPGVPAALAYVSAHYGDLNLQTVLAPAIELAEHGFAIDQRYLKGAQHKKNLLLKNREAADIFLDHGEVPAIGWRLKQPDLANTLRQISLTAGGSFYQGRNAEHMVDDIRHHGGIWSIKDLNNYKIIIREPIVGTYRGTKIITPDLPSSGGLVLNNTLNILAGFDLPHLPSATQKHLIIEALKRGYQERAEVMGDKDFIDVPSERLLSQQHATQQRQSIHLDKATDSHLLSPLKPEINKGTDTTHFAAIDKKGNRVAVTQSINFWFGSGFVPQGTGVLLNNEMDDFSIKPGIENGYGLIGGRANAIAPGKRMLSSMTPTFLENEKGMAILGTPGGSRIISMVLLGTLNWLEGLNAKDIVTAPRFHHQFHPDVVYYEEGSFSPDEIHALHDKGHTLKQTSQPYGNMQAILWDYHSNKITTASDPRGSGSGRVY